MHLQYAKRLDQSLDYKSIDYRYKRNIQQSYNLYLFSVLQLIKTVEFARADVEKRLAKYLPTEEDKKFSAKIYDNPLVQSIVNCDAFKKMLKERSILAMTDKDRTKLFYTEFIKTAEFKAYMNGESSKDDHKHVLLALYRFCINNETYDDYLEEKFDNWIHDKSLIVGAVKKTIKSLPNEDDFFKTFVPSDPATLEFGEDLLYKSNHFDSDLLELIKPTLKNWDIDRVAIIDLVLLKLALCEMLYFPTIPVKVTINEFIDISKIYSTPKSKDFINGILDKLMKKLKHSGRINKEGRGLLE